MTQLNTVFPQILQEEERCDSRTFIVPDAASDQESIRFYRVIGSIDPSVAFRHNVQMADQTDFLGSVPVRDRACITVRVLHVKTFFRAALEGVIEHLAAIRPVRRPRSGQVRTGHRRMTHPVLKLFDHLNAVFLCPVVQFFSAEIRAHVNTSL